jgi:hypothetical protein
MNCLNCDTLTESDNHACDICGNYLCDACYDNYTKLKNFCCMKCMKKMIENIYNKNKKK